MCDLHAPTAGAPPADLRHLCARVPLDALLHLARRTPGAEHRGADVEEVRRDFTVSRGHQIAKGPLQVGSAKRRGRSNDVIQRNINHLQHPMTGTLAVIDDDRLRGVDVKDARHSGREEEKIHCR
ncbi:unnamed protein product, partial [Ectocarpus sp. 12 AP-2014]